MIPAVLHPKSRGFLKLKDNDPLSHPLISPLYYTHPDDVKVMVEGIKFGIKLSETNGTTGIFNILFILLTAVGFSFEKVRI